MTKSNRREGVKKVVVGTKYLKQLWVVYGTTVDPQFTFAGGPSSAAGEGRALCGEVAAPGLLDISDLTLVIHWSNGVNLSLPDRVPRHLVNERAPEILDLPPSPADHTVFFPIC